MRKELIYRLKLEPHQVTVIPNPIGLKKLQQMAGEPFDHPWFKANSPPVIIGVGRLVPEKDFVTLIRAFAIVRQQVEARLLILGEGIMRPYLEECIAELDLNAAVEMPGFDSNPYRWLAGARLLVSSSLWEGYPNVILEAQMLGISVVATAYDDSIIEVLDPQNHKNVVPVSNPEALASTIIKILRDDPHVANKRLASGTQDLIDRYLQTMNVSPN
jgi:glycosyltransferase involved in cell wall biosynthesis